MSFFEPLSFWDRELRNPDFGLFAARAEKCLTKTAQSSLSCLSLKYTLRTALEVMIPRNQQLQPELSTTKQQLKPKLQKK